MRPAANPAGGSNNRGRTVQAAATTPVGGSGGQSAQGSLTAAGNGNSLLVGSTATSLPRQSGDPAARPSSTLDPLQDRSGLLGEILGSLGGYFPGSRNSNAGGPSPAAARPGDDNNSDADSVSTVADDENGPSVWWDSMDRPLSFPVFSGSDVGSTVAQAQASGSAANRDSLLASTSNATAARQQQLRTRDAGNVVPEWSAIAGRAAGDRRSVNPFEAATGVAGDRRSINPFEAAAAAAAAANDQGYTWQQPQARPSLRADDPRRYSVNPFDIASANAAASGSTAQPVPSAPATYAPGDRRSINPFDPLMVNATAAALQARGSLPRRGMPASSGLLPVQTGAPEPMSPTTPDSPPPSPIEAPTTATTGPVLQARPISTAYLPPDLSNGFAPPTADSVPIPDGSAVMETPSELISHMNTVTSTPSRTHNRRFTGGRAIDGLRRMVGLPPTPIQTTEEPGVELESTSEPGTPVSTEGANLQRTPSWVTAHRRLGSLFRSNSGGSGSGQSQLPNSDVVMGSVARRNVHRRQDSYATLVGSPTSASDELDDAERWRLPDLDFFESEEQPSGASTPVNPEEDDELATTTRRASASSTSQSQPESSTAKASSAASTKEGYEEAYRWPDDEDVAAQKARMASMADEKRLSRAPGEYLDYGTGETRPLSKADYEDWKNVDEKVAEKTEWNEDEFEAYEKPKRLVDKIWNRWTMLVCCLLSVAIVLSIVGVGVFLGNKSRTVEEYMLKGGTLQNPNATIPLSLTTSVKTTVKTTTTSRTTVSPIPAPVLLDIGGACTNATASTCKSSCCSNLKCATWETCNPPAPPPLADLGGQCTAKEGCKSGCCNNSTCKAWEVCNPPAIPTSLELGQTCDPNNAGRCKSGCCSSGTCQVHEVCYPPAPVLAETGQTCTANDKCKSACCSAGTCQAHEICFPPAPSANGVACSADARCQSGCCKDGVCSQYEVCHPAAEGAGCSANELCASGCCNSGVCRANAVCFPPPPAAEGQQCSEGSGCQSGCCSGGICRANAICYPPPPPPQAEIGGSCTQLDNCKSGCCINGQCSPYQQCFPSDNGGWCSANWGCKSGCCSNSACMGIEVCNPPPPPPPAAQSGTRQNPAPMDAWCDGWWESCQSGCCSNNVCKTMDVCKPASVSFGNCEEDIRRTYLLTFSPCSLFPATTTSTANRRFLGFARRLDRRPCYLLPSVRPEPKPRLLVHRRVRQPHLGQPLGPPNRCVEHCPVQLLDVFTVAVHHDLRRREGHLRLVQDRRRLLRLRMG